MKRFVVLAVLTAFATGALASAAAAGGFATLQLSAVPEDGTTAGTSLPIDITVLAHGRTPVDGISPVFRIRDSRGGIVASYDGVPTGEPGTYHVDVAFPAQGRFVYEVFDGYGAGQVHGYPAVEIGPAGGAGVSVADGGSFPWLPVGAVALLAVGLAAAATLLIRRRTGTIRPRAV